jgi:hypothetical protein
LISKLRQLVPINHYSECGLEWIAANSNRCGNKSRLNRLLKQLTIVPKYRFEYFIIFK